MIDDALQVLLLVAQILVKQVYWETFHGGNNEKGYKFEPVERYQEISESLGICSVELSTLTWMLSVIHVICMLLVSIHMVLYVSVYCLCVIWMLLVFYTLMPTSQVEVGCPWASYTGGCNCNHTPRQKNTHRPTNLQPSHQPPHTQPPTIAPITLRPEA